MSDEKKAVHTIAAVVEDDLYKAVSDLKWELRLSMSEILRKALADFVDENRSW